MKSPDSLTSLLLAAASALGISACDNTEPERNSPRCGKDSDCAPEQICNTQNMCVDPGLEMLTYHEGSTSSSGKITLAQTSITTTQRDGNPISNIHVYYAGNSQGKIILVIDPQRRFQPEVVQRTVSRATSSLSSEVPQALRGDVTIPLDPIETGKKIYGLLSSDRRTFLGRVGPVNRYCMTLEQLEHSEIDIPVGLVMLASDAAGFEAEKIKVAVTTTLKEIFSNWIINKFGTLPAYEVWVPRTAVNVCDEQDYGTVCDITTYSLSQRVWNPQGMPYWEIKGGCPGTSSPADSGTIPGRGDSIRIASISPPLTCIQFDKHYAVDVAVDYTHGTLSPGNFGEIKLQLSSYDCPFLNTVAANASSGRVTLHGEFTPSECYEREPVYYKLSTLLDSCNENGCAPLAQDEKTVGKCE